MMGRVLAAEFATLRRSPLVWLTILLAVGGSILARVVAWVAHALERSEIGELLIFGGISWSAVAVPLALLAYLIAAAYLFGRDFDDGSIDFVLTSPIRRELIALTRLTVLTVWVLALALISWWADAAMRAILATTSFDPGAEIAAATAIAAALAAIATLPLVAWMAMRLKGSLPALGIGIAIQAAVLFLGDLVFIRALPWFLPVALAAEETTPWLVTAGAGLLFAAGVFMCVRELRQVDLYE